MAMSITVAADSDVDALEGTNAAAGFTDAMKDSVGLMGEAYVSGIMRFDIVTNWGSVNAKTRAVVTEYVARLIAAAAIAWDMSGFTSRIEAEDMLNLHVFRMRQCEALLADQKFVTFNES